MTMLLPDTTIFSSCYLSSASNHLFPNKRSTNLYSTIVRTKKNNLSEHQNNNTNFPQLRPISTTFLAQSASVLFALGFVDAGYSGDWSRIGAISEEAEGLLKLAAFLVVPFCLFLVFWLWNKSKEVS